MIDRIAKIILISVFVMLVSFIGFSGLIDLNAKAESASINTQMKKLENLYIELYTFHKRPEFLQWGFGTLGEGTWSDSIKKLDKDKSLNTYVTKLSPDWVETEEIFFGDFKPRYLWLMGRYYMNNFGKESKDTLYLKKRFMALFKAHKQATGK